MHYIYDGGPKPVGLVIWRKNRERLKRQPTELYALGFFDVVVVLRRGAGAKTLARTSDVVLFFRHKYMTTATT